MEKNKFMETLNRLEREVEDLEELNRMISYCFVHGNRDKAYELSFEFVKTAEKITLLARTLPCYTGKPKASIEVENCIAEIVPIEIGFTKEGWFCVRIPKLLPKKGFGDVNYIRGILWPALREFFKEKSVMRYDKSVLIYRHVYGPQYKKRYMRDHDNIETYMISDMVATYVLRDDCPYLCNNYDCTAEGGDERTEVYVVPQSEFIDWLTQEKTMPKGGVKLYETKFSRA